MKTITISYDEEMQAANVYDTESASFVWFRWNDNFEIWEEQQDTDNQDFNDNARWLVKTLLEILKLEKNDDCAHCDWSADFDEFPETGKYKFKVSIEKVKEKE